MLTRRFAAVWGLLGKAARPKCYNLSAMTELLKKALEAVSALPREAQNEIARAMLRLAREESEPETIEPEHLPAVLEALSQAKRGELAGFAEVEAAFRHFEG
ncbi:MAG: hypothetical protein U1E87_08940 [Alphaproteobacteria bacterium]